jgi:hypothetical protein
VVHRQRRNSGQSLKNEVVKMGKEFIDGDIYIGKTFYLCKDS